MGEVNPVNPLPPPERSLADERALDEKLSRAARRVHDGIAERHARGEAGTAAEILRGRQPWIVPLPTPSDQIIARIGPDESPDTTPRRVGWIRPEGYAEAVVPGRFRSVTFDSYAPQTPSQKTALRAVRQWLEARAAGKTPMLALIGPTGAGKSHLLYAAANALLAANERVYARPWYRLADELRYGGPVPWAPKIAMEAHAVRELLWSHKLVLIDEVRPTASTAFDDTELAKFSCHAYDNDIAVLITTNVSPLADVMGPPAASRFTQIVVDGPDWRQT